jgi:hypothetical protein
MGRCDYSQVGYGMTQSEAHRDALESDRNENGHQDGYSGGMSSSTDENDKVKCLVKPKQAKKCTVTKIKQEGTRKWETVYVCSPYRSYGTERCDIIHVKTTQADAIKKAKELALKHNVNYVINIEKHLKGESKIATVAPAQSTQGKWLFTGTARE